MFVALLMQALILFAAITVTAFTLEVVGYPVISDWEWEVQRVLRQGNQ